MSRKRTQLAEVLPAELLEEIVTRLDVKSLIRFKLVSKFWHSIISSSRFMNNHFNRSSEHPKLLISLKNSNVGSLGCLLSSADSPDCDVLFETDRTHTLASTFLFKVDHDGMICSRVSESVAGLILLQFHNEDFIMICNPSTRESIRINFPPPPRGVSKKFKFGGRAFLGFDPVGKQFKVLCRCVGCIGGEWKPWHYVMTLGNDAWRPIECNYPPYCSADIYIDGKIYYTCSDRSFGAIVFDVRSETFEHIPIPADFPNANNPFLVNYSGSVAAVKNTWTFDVGGDIFMNVLNPNHVWNSMKFPEPYSYIELAAQSFIAGSFPNGKILLLSDVEPEQLKLDIYDVEIEEKRGQLIVTWPVEHSAQYSNTKCRVLTISSHVERLESLEGLSPTYQFQRY